MTVCIAARFEDTNQIIVVTDSRISSDSESAEGVRKLFFLPRDRWAIMFAGDVRYATPLIERIRATMPQNRDLPLDEFIKVCEEAHHAELLKRIETEILLPFGMSRLEFLSTGRLQFGELRFDATVERILQTDLGVDLLCAGFDENGYPHLFELTATGVVARYAHLPFHAIGSGAPMALSSLYPVRIASQTFEELLYRCCASKFAAESSPAVGRDTLVYTFASHPGSIRHVMSGYLDPLREIWNSLGQPPVPDEALGFVKRQFEIALQNHRVSVRSRSLLEHQWNELQKRKGRPVKSEDT